MGGVCVVERKVWGGEIEVITSPASGSTGPVQIGQSAGSALSLNTSLHQNDPPADTVRVNTPQRLSCSHCHNSDGMAS
jgi:hypothetical protein